MKQCSQGSKFFPIRIDLFIKGSKLSFDKVASLKCVASVTHTDPHSTGDQEVAVWHR